MAIWTYSGNVYNSSPAGTTAFPLTSMQGNSIGYLQRSHVHVYSSVNEGELWVELGTPAEYGFNAEGTGIVLTAGIEADTWIKVQRITPHLDEYVNFHASSQLTAGQLNTGELFSMYVDQELRDWLSDITGGGTGPGDLIPLKALGDVTITSPVNFDLLAFDATVQQWVNKDFTEITEATVGIDDLNIRVALTRFIIIARPR